MKKLLLSLFAVMSLSASAQVTVFEDSFETYEDFVIEGFGDWITLDKDGLGTYIGGLPDDLDPWPNAFDPQAWMVFNPTQAGVTNSTDACTATLENRNFDPHTGSKYAASWAGSPAGGVTRNEDWLVSPIINLGASNNKVTFWVKQLSSCYGNESYRVCVVPGSTVIDNNTVFSTVISGSAPGNQTATVNWVEKTFDIPASFANSSIRVAILNRSADAYMLMVDDFKVTSSNMATNDLLAKRFSLYPNPSSNVINISSSDAIPVNQVSITDLNGRVVKTNDFGGSAQAQVNISDLASGVYMMNISSAEGTAVKRIVRN